MSFIRRLKLFGIGFIMGLLIVYILFGQRQCTGNSELKIQELRHQPHFFSDSFLQQSVLHHIDTTVFTRHLSRFKVDFNQSKVHAKPFGFYILISDTPSVSNYTLVIEDRDSITYFKTLNVTQKQ